MPAGSSSPSISLTPTVLGQAHGLSRPSPPPTPPVPQPQTPSQTPRASLILVSGPPPTTTTDSGRLVVPQSPTPPQTTMSSRQFTQVSVAASSGPSVASLTGRASMTGPSVVRVVSSPAHPSSAAEVPVLPLHILQQAGNVPTARSAGGNFVMMPPGSSMVLAPQLDSSQQQANSANAAAAAAAIRSRSSSAGAQRCAAFPGVSHQGLMAVPSGRSTTNSSGSSMPGSTAAMANSTHQQSRPRSAQSRMGAYAYLQPPTAAPGPRIQTPGARGRATTVTTPQTGPTWSPRTGRPHEKALHVVKNDVQHDFRQAQAVPAAASPRVASPRGGALAPRTLASPRMLSPALSPPRTSLSPRRDTTANGGLAATWSDLLDLVQRSRPAVNNHQVPNGGEPCRPRENLPPDPGRTRRACQALAGVVNRLPDDLLRRVLTVLSEELFNSIFRDYGFSYDPRDEMWSPEGRLTSPSAGSRPPRLCEESLANAVPYSAVVQSLRDAAKDAIMRRLELEAKCSCMIHHNTETETPNVETPTACGDGACSESNCGGRAGQSPANNARAAEGFRAGDEVQLREELRHARVRANTYHARTLELERERIELEEEVRRLKAETDNARVARGAYEERSVTNGSTNGTNGVASARVTVQTTAKPTAGGGVSSRRNLTDRRSTAPEKQPAATGVAHSARTSVATSNQAGLDSHPNSPIVGSPMVEEHGSISTLNSQQGPSEDDTRLRRGLGGGSSGSTRDAVSARSLRTPRERSSLGIGGSSGSATSVSASSVAATPLQQGGRQDTAADVAAGGRLRRGSAGNSRTMLETGSNNNGSGGSSRTSAAGTSSLLAAVRQAKASDRGVRRTPYT
eukprot:TRINITY_DN10400_c0_g1_i3.p1 TRINITY_DN10400_c0_g1~~TRINITY_DN10400_c0_g1_i3.p1  ORF type:complete len:956 (-),score=142.58 TRINITY_DN10400_c0_g1_i3:90-2648(-)